jgi:hypothetical protein
MRLARRCVPWDAHNDVTEFAYVVTASTRWSLGELSATWLFGAASNLQALLAASRFGQSWRDAYNVPRHRSIRASLKKALGWADRRRRKASICSPSHHQAAELRTLALLSGP